jgi:hypothetical protein
MLFLGTRLVCQLCTRKVELAGGQDGGQCFDVDVNGCDKIEELLDLECTATTDRDSAALSDDHTAQRERALDVGTYRPEGLGRFQSRFSNSTISIAESAWPRPPISSVHMLGFCR